MDPFKFLPRKKLESKTPVADLSSLQDDMLKPSKLVPAEKEGLNVDKGTLGDLLQVGSTLGRTLRKDTASVEPGEELSHTRINAEPILRRSQRTYNAALENLNLQNPAASDALRANLYAQKLKSDSDVLSRIMDQNNQMAQRTNMYNIQQRRMTRDINQRRDDAATMANDDRLASLMNLGIGFSQQASNQRGQDALFYGFPDVAPKQQNKDLYAYRDYGDGNLIPINRKGKRINKWQR